MSAPIWIDCEGIGCPTHAAVGFIRSGMCQMCGQIVVVDMNGNATHHQRDDVIARIERGDFD